MVELEEFAIEHNCRLVITGDTKQHHSVQWDEGLQILERSGAIAQFALTKIYRQQIIGLCEAIEDLSKGRSEAARLGVAVGESLVSAAETAETCASRWIRHHLVKMTCAGCSKGH